ncbi:MAG: dienelactone hydrolase family protein [Saprospiraceae bacterium]
MFKNLTLLTLICSLFLFACGDAGQSTAEQSDNMGQFADDKEFKDAHEKPTATTVAGKGEIIEFATPDGQKATAYTITPEEPSNKYLMVIHEWYGLNDHIKNEAQRLFDSLENVNVMALDIYDGKVADNPDDAGKYMQAIKEERAQAIVDGAITHAGEDAEIGTIGWCFGGGWSLKTSIAAGDKAKACVIYYGMPVQTADKLVPLEAPIVFIHPTKDKWINEEVVSNFKKLTDATGKEMEVYTFEADHAFANPSSPRYQAEAAQEANEIALEFLSENL